ncbi:hypothetical protein Taro_020407 [Colocasia esculenta]|uniref:Nitroreductase domain-containing protein n=1 Tax=Colocasia esculenta TaxID=4460 RepID=A0A843UWB1_COLES|nr:hypothetical protein [Colocasia esculenta]
MSLRPSRSFLPLRHQPLSPFPSSPASSRLPPHRRTTTSASSSPPPSAPMHPPASAKDAEADQEQQRRQQQAQAYHSQTKHSLTAGYARGPRGLDWANQPNPFLRFARSPLLPLLHLPPDSHHHHRQHQPPSPAPIYHSVFSALPCVPPQPLSHASISQLFYDSLSLSAWKTTGVSTWSLRVNPSSGNLHPTEAYLLSPPLLPSSAADAAASSSPASSSPFVAHYAPKEHALDLRALLPHDFLPRFFPPSSVLVGFSSIFWREAWKYGERAFRYCNHDVGHAIAAVAIAAGSLGWDARLLDGLGSSDLRNLFGLGKGFPSTSPPAQLPSRPTRGRFPWVEMEHPDCVLLVFPAGSSSVFSIDYASLSKEISKFPSLEWFGSPNSLSKDHVCWDIIYRTAEAVEKPLTEGEHFSIDPFSSSGLISDGLYKKLTVREVVRKRRSAVDMDGVHVMKKETFYQIMLHCLPSGDVGRGGRQGKQLALPFRVLPWDSEVHAALFVHRVAGLPKGLYFLVRNEDHFDILKQTMRSDFEWVKPDGCPDGLPLYRLASSDCQVLAKQLSCHQDIASDGSFSLGMVARFEPALHERKAWMYPRLFWETGILGQVLYLEAHAVGISATGIGCYFDDAVHDVLGLSGSEFQSLYHFTVGGPVLDKRIMSLPAYPGPDVDA